MENRVGAGETGWTWTGGSSTSNDTCAEICGDGVDAAVKDGAAIVIALLTGAHPSWQSLKPINFPNKNLFPAIKFDTKLILMFFYFREALVRAVVIHGFSIISK